MILGPDLRGCTVRPVPIYARYARAARRWASRFSACLIPAWLAARIEPFANMQEV